MASNLCCCSPCRPAYKSHVDSIYPTVPEQGLVKSKMEQLVYFALTSPEKLDRLVEYLAQRISRDIYRNKKEFAFIGMEAMDQLLSPCVRTLNLFIESYLKTIQRLLESPDPDFQVLASESFTHFSKIEEETPSYHRTYDFFIDRFSQMCHSSTSGNYGSSAEEQKSIRQRLRISGLQGISGVIRKSVNEDLSENIWDAKHMEKIVPSLLFNLEYTAGRMSPDLSHLESDVQEENALQLADQILRELVQAATSISIKTILTPVLQHIDNHKQWDPERQIYAVSTFTAIMYSIQTDLSYILIERIIDHMSNAANIVDKGNIANVLGKIISIGVGESTVGPAVLEIITSLLKHLKSSVEESSSFEEQSSEPMQQFHRALFHCLGEYTGRMPDFQKSENMSFILSKIPLDSLDPAGERSRKESDVQHILMKALYTVAEGHRATLFSSTFNPQVLHSLLRLLMVNDPDVRLLVLQTLQILADRHENLPKLAVPTLSPSELDLFGFPAKKNRADHLFAQKSLFRVYAAFKQVLAEHTSSKEFLETFYSTTSILVVEMSGTDEGIVSLLDLIDGIQVTAVKELALNTTNRFNLHGLAVSLFSLLATIVAIPEIDTYLDEIVRARRMKASHMLPPMHDHYNPGLDPNTPDDNVLINVERVKEALKNAGKNVEQMSTQGDKFIRPIGRTAWTDNQLHGTRRQSAVSVSSTEVEFAESASSSPGIGKKTLPDDVSVKSIRKILEGTERIKEQELADKRELQTRCAYSTWEDLCMNQQSSKKPDLRDLSSDIASKLSFGMDQAEFDTTKQLLKFSLKHQVFDNYFPEIYLY